MNHYYYVEVTCQAKGLTAAELEERFVPIADAVYDLTGVIDADLGADFGALTLDFTMGINAESEVQALSTALAATRTALHAAGHSTHGWEQHFDTIRQEIRRQDTEYA